VSYGFYSTYEPGADDLRKFGGLVDPDNEVRFIEAFTDQLDLRRLAVVVKELKKEGSPAYESRVFLKLYFYGYLNA